jgi:hypothetical protein
MAPVGECFTEDGVFDGLSRIEGRTAVQNFFSEPGGGGLTALWHHVSNYEITVAGDSATVRSLLWQPCVVGGVPHVSAGRYRDQLVRTTVGWRIREKQVAFPLLGTVNEGWEPPLRLRAGRSRSDTPRYGP